MKKDKKEEETFDSLDEIFRSFKKDGFFSKEPLTRGEVLHLIFILTAIGLIIFYYNNPVCTLDCSDCIKDYVQTNMINGAP